jgi:hypothetical protein
VGQCTKKGAPIEYTFQSLSLEDESESDEPLLEELPLPLLLLPLLLESLSLLLEVSEEEESAFLRANSAGRALMSLGAFFKNKRKSSLHTQHEQRTRLAPTLGKQEESLGHGVGAGTARTVARQCVRQGP